MELLSLSLCMTTVVLVVSKRETEASWERLFISSCLRIQSLTGVGKRCRNPALNKQDIYTQQGSKYNMSRCNMPQKKYISFLIEAKE